MVKSVLHAQTGREELRAKWKDIERILLDESAYIEQMQLLLKTKVYNLMRAALEVIYFIIDKYPQRKKYANTHTVSALLNIF